MEGSPDSPDHGAVQGARRLGQDRSMCRSLFRARVRALFRARVRALFRARIRALFRARIRATQCESEPATASMIAGSTRPCSATLDSPRARCCGRAGRGRVTLDSARTTLRACATQARATRACGTLDSAPATFQARATRACATLSRGIPFIPFIPVVPVISLNPGESRPKYAESVPVHRADGAKSGRRRTAKETLCAARGTL